MFQAVGNVVQQPLDIGTNDGISKTVTNGRRNDCLGVARRRRFNRAILLRIPCHSETGNGGLIATLTGRAFGRSWRWDYVTLIATTTTATTSLKCHRLNRDNGNRLPAI